jgi:hypothetical protein
MLLKQADYRKGFVEKYEIGTARIKTTNEVLN